MNWFYESGGQQQGPVTEHDLDRLIAEGKINEETLIWKEGMPDWQPLRMARPSSAGTPLPPPLDGTAGDVPPGYVRCALTGKILPESEAIFIQGKAYSPEAKPQVLHSLQTGTGLPMHSDTERTGPPWEDRKELGFVAGWWKTVSGVLINPVETFRQMRRTGGLISPLMFYLLMSYATALIGIAMAFAFGQFDPLFNPNAAQPIPNQLPPEQVPFVIAAAIVGIFIFTPVMAFVFSGIVHLCLMMLGGARQGFETTFRVGCYSWGAASILSLLPVCAQPVFLVWGVVAMSIGLANAHETDTGRATASVLLPLLLCCGMIAILFGFTFASAYGTLQAIQPAE